MYYTEGEMEGVSEFIRRLEYIFQVAFGHDHMSAKTKKTCVALWQSTGWPLI